MEQYETPEAILYWAGHVDRIDSGHFNLPILVILRLRDPGCYPS